MDNVISLSTTEAWVIFGVFSIVLLSVVGIWNHFDETRKR